MFNISRQLFQKVKLVHIVDSHSPEKRKSSHQLINSKHLQRFPEPSICQSGSVHTTTTMGETADLTVVQKTFICV